MKQLLQHLSTGTTEIADVPPPKVRPGHLFIQSRRTLVSAGTERMLVQFGKAGWLAKARQQPDKVRMVVEKIRTDGLLPTLDAVRSKLDSPLALGYCNVGTVLDVGQGVNGFSVGESVVSNGPHSEFVCVPENLCARIPSGVSDDAAAFTVLGAIGLQGIRLAQPTLGEAFVVTGLGLIGLLTVQLLRAQGCRVLGIDFDPQKVELARGFGAEGLCLRDGVDPITAAGTYSRGRGVDGVIITASTKSNEPVHQAAQMCRKRGRIILVGVTGLELSRADFYEKELSFQVSCSYGPGRYDPEYEEKGHDYPIGFVRWTEQRNFEAVLDMMADSRIDVTPLISHRFPIEQADQAYALLTADEPSLGILIDYASESRESIGDRVIPLKMEGEAREGKPRVSFIGAGNYAGRILIPAFDKAGADFRMVASSGGVSGAHFGRKHAFQAVSSDASAVITDPETDAIVVATRHNTHARLVVESLRAGKHVFVEKPLVLTLDELSEVRTAYSERATSGDSPVLVVGFNRRFAPHVTKMKSLLSGVTAPKTLIMTVNAGEIPMDHWTQDREVGGGRIVGEACHFVDLLRFIVDAPISAAKVTSVADPKSGAKVDDITSFTLSFADGSMGTVHYLANGHKAFPKERLEVFCAGRILALDNFRSLKGLGWSGFRGVKHLRQDKGQEACSKAFLEAIGSGGPSPIPFEELVEVSEWTIKIANEAAS